MINNKNTNIHSGVGKIFFLNDQMCEVAACMKIFKQFRTSQFASDRIQSYWFIYWNRLSAQIKINKKGFFSACVIYWNYI